MEQFKQKFIADALELLQKLENSLLMLEEHKSDKSITVDIFRTMHTLKGTAGMYGFDAVENLTHHFESIYDLIRNGKLTISKHIIDLSFKVADLLKKLLSATDESVYKNEIAAILNELDVGMDNESGTDENAANQEYKANCYYVLLHPDIDIYKRSINPQSVVDEIAALGKLEYIVHTGEIPLVEQEKLKESSAFWEFFLATNSDKSEIEDVFIFYLDDEFDIYTYDKSVTKGCKPMLEKHLDNFLKYSKDFNIESKIEEIKATFEKISPFVNKIHEPAPIKEVDIKNEQVVFAPLQRTSIRVESEKLDELMNLVSELVNIKARISLIDLEQNYELLTSAVDEMSKLTNKFRDNVLDIRLIPIESILVNLKRMTRSLANSLGKKIEFISEGADTELDKTIIENLESPLMHLIRNSIDHGIEQPEERLAKGKPETGTVRFLAFYSGSQVFIQIQDNGAGIHPDKIRLKAIEKKLIQPTDKLSKTELLELIFTPGFSTATTVTEVSGRGVGMDAVQRIISELRGEIEIDSEVGLGTSITVKLPITLSIIDTLLVKTGTTNFLIPIAAVETCEMLLNKPLSGLNRKQVEYDNRLIPFISLRDEFSIAGDNAVDAKIIVISNNDRKIAILVDTILGEHQAVIKPLGDVFKNLDFLSGASILGNGELALILDTNKLIGSFKSANNFVTI
ncbi:MAG TPA: chemotaxis protein CheA [Bacteroidales bacterium]|nr:chemotaxis protein CheA [Bacteroidales bacterium]